MIKSPETVNESTLLETDVQIVYGKFVKTIRIYLMKFLKKINRHRYGFCVHASF